MNAPAAVSTLPPEVIAAAGRGWRLFPVESRGKLPLVKEWQKVAASDLAQLEAWTVQFPGCNWGLATGTASGLVVIDVDGEAGRASVAALERQSLTLPWSLTVTTGRTDGGEHRYYRPLAGVDIRNDQSGKIGAHIDVRGAGGFVVCPPSVHASGKQYRFIDPSAPVADLPGWVIERLTVRPPMPRAMAQASPQAVGHGSRTNTLVSLAGTMHKRGMSPEAIEAALLAENAAKCDPPLPEAKVRGIAADIVKRYPAGESAAKLESDFKLVGLGDLLSRPVVPVDYVLQGRLVAGSVSIVASKPKVGKSTLARNLALAVARGESFLGWPVKQGAVLYLALEERCEDVATDFRAMGATGSEDIQIADAGTVLDVVTILQDKKPVLLVVDPLFRLVRIQDGNSYAETYGALGPLIDAARETGTHILCLHHSSKAAKAESIDAPIGSTALAGAVSTLLVMLRTESYRTLQTVQRIGTDLPETVLRFDPVKRLLSLGGLREGLEVANVGAAILEALASNSMSEPEIGDAVEGKNARKRKALRELTSQGKIARSGSGKRGDPYKYGKGCTLVPSPIEKNGYKKPLEGVSEEPNVEEKKVVPVLHNNMGYESTSNSNDPEGGTNIEEMLVPAKTGLPLNSEKTGTSNLVEVRV